jgi:hypothetical protein
MKASPVAGVRARVVVVLHLVDGWGRALVAAEKGWMELGWAWLAMVGQRRFQGQARASQDVDSREKSVRASVLSCPAGTRYKILRVRFSVPYLHVYLQLRQDAAEQ